MSRLSLTVYEDSTKASMIADWSSRAQRVTFDTDAHGFGYLSAYIPMTTAEAFRIYNGIAFAHVLLSSGASVAFEGRLEDRRIEPDRHQLGSGLTIGAYGYWRALSDFHYSDLWSETRYSEFTRLSDSYFSSARPSKYHQEENDSLFLTLRKNESYANGSDDGGWFIRVPHRKSRVMAKVTFDYDITMPNNWVIRTQTADDDLTGNTTEDTITGNSANQTGSKSITGITASKEAIIIYIRNTTGSTATVSVESDDWYVKLTNVRIWTLNDTAIYADDVIGALLTSLNSVNSSQISSSTVYVDSPAIDLVNYRYEDETPAKVITDLAAMGDSSGNAWDAKVWEDQKLRFQQRGTGGRSWYVDAGNIVLDSTIEDMRNKAYTVYRDESGQVRRTAGATDSASISKYGVTRNYPVRSQTTDDAEAVEFRDTYIEDHKDITPRTRIDVSEVFTASGARADLHQVRSGDDLTIRGLPPGSGGVVDKIRTMYIAATSWQAGENGSPDILTVYPGAELPSLELLVARNSVNGVNR